jgi:hypothetical protein
MSSLADKEERQEIKERIMESVGDDYLVAQARCVEKFGPEGGIFARQLLFWEGKGHDAEGWIYKTQREWTAETGLSRRQQDKARRVLAGKEVLEEDRRPNPHNGYRPQLYYRLDLAALTETLNPSSRPSGTSAQANVPGINEQTSVPGSTERARLSSSTDLPSRTTSSEQAITESTSENTAENTQENNDRELRLQAGADGSSSRHAPPPSQEKEVGKEEDAKTTEPAPISLLSTKRAESIPDKPPRVSPEEIHGIMKMLTDESYPTCGVYRRFEDGKLSDQDLLRSISHELTGSFEEVERFRWSVEECVKLLREEEGIA